MSEKQKPELIATEAHYIDPLDSDSMVSYKITTDSYVNISGSVELSDCNRKISWYFSNNDDAITKVDKAIEILRNFRREFIKARKRFPKKKAA
jgi:hypothetical protein